MYKRQHLGRGLYSFALGLGKKVLVADSLAKIVSQGYADVTALNSTEALLVMVCYSLQLYFDFSGYCDMASGIALMFNVNLPVNFHSPYKACLLYTALLKDCRRGCVWKKSDGTGKGNDHSQCH